MDEQLKWTAEEARQERLSDQCLFACDHCHIAFPETESCEMEEEGLVLCEDCYKKEINEIKKASLSLDERVELAVVDARNERFNYQQVLKRSEHRSSNKTATLELIQGKDEIDRAFSSLLRALYRLDDLNNQRRT